LTEAEILLKLSEVFREVFRDPTITATPEMTADDVEKWDSLTHIDMIVFVEETFGVRLPTRQVVNLENVGDLVGLIQTKLN
jgi:acyl carrier protein